MKKKSNNLLLSVILLFSSTFSNAEMILQCTCVPEKTVSITVTWLPPIARCNGTPLGADEIAYYVLKYGSSAEKLETFIEIPGSDQSATIDNLEPGDYYFSIKVVDTQGRESLFSEVKKYTKTE